MIENDSLTEPQETTEESQPEENLENPNQDVETEMNEDSSQEDETEEEQDIVPEKRLPWLVNDFRDTTESVYEAASIASVRSRQIGRKQKQEIDDWFTAHDITEGDEEVEEESEPGVDHFNHIKPTVQALQELTKQEINYRYLEKKKK